MWVATDSLQTITGPLSLRMQLWTSGSPTLCCLLSSGKDPRSHRPCSDTNLKIRSFRYPLRLDYAMTCPHLASFRRLCIPFLRKRFFLLWMSTVILFSLLVATLLIVPRQIRVIRHSLVEDREPSPLHSPWRGSLSDRILKASRLAQHQWTDCPPWIREFEMDHKREMLKGSIESPGPVICDPTRPMTHDPT